MLSILGSLTPSRTSINFIVITRISISANKKSQQWLYALVLSIAGIFFAEWSIYRVGSPLATLHCSRLNRSVITIKWVSLHFEHSFGTKGCQNQQFKCCLWCENPLKGIKIRCYRLQIEKILLSLRAFVYSNETKQ